MLLFCITMFSFLPTALVTVIEPNVSDLLITIIPTDKLVVLFKLMVQFLILMFFEPSVADALKIAIPYSVNATELLPTGSIKLIPSIVKKSVPTIFKIASPLTPKLDDVDVAIDPKAGFTIGFAPAPDFWNTIGFAAVPVAFKTSAFVSANVAPAATL